MLQCERKQEIPEINACIDVENKLLQRDYQLSLLIFVRQEHQPPGSHLTSLSITSIFTSSSSSSMDRPFSFIQLDSFISNILYPIYLLSLLSTCPDLLRLASLTLSPNCSTSAVSLIGPFVASFILVTSVVKDSRLSWC